MSTTLHLTDIDPTKLVTGNRRIHYMVRSQIAGYWRIRARNVALTAYGHARQGQAWHQRARIVITFRYPDLRRRDCGNLYPYVAKPCVDGLIDAHLLPDDSDAYLVGPDLRRDPGRGPHLITIEIQDLTSAGHPLHLDDVTVDIDEPA